MKDAYGNLVTGLKPDAPQFSGAASTGTERPSAGSWTETSNGVYVATLTLGSAAGQLSVMPRVNDQNAVAQPLVLNVAGDASKAEIRDMTVKVDNQLANGQSTNQVTLTVVDSYGNPLQGQEVTLTLPQGVTSKTGNTVTTNAAGKADIELISTVAGKLEIAYRGEKLSEDGHGEIQRGCQHRSGKPAGRHRRSKSGKRQRCLYADGDR